MVRLTIDGKEVRVQKGTTILEAAKKAGIRIPTLCYLKEVSETAACRVCLVKIEGEERLSASCNTLCEEGMVVSTDHPEVLSARKENLKLLLSRHNTSCTTCVRDGSCRLQELSKEMNLTENPYPVRFAKKNWDASLPLQKDASKCIQCLRCINICEKIQSANVWELRGTGAAARVGIRDGLSFAEAGCTYCGQCITHCPTGALSARDDTEKFRAFAADKELTTVVQIAPAVRTGFAEAAGLSGEKGTEKRMAAALKKLGADYVFSTDFTADLTIMEEGTELLHRIKEKGTAAEAEERGEKVFLPMFTSCCPGWVRFLKYHYPDMVSCLSSAKSPQQMFGAVTKTYFAEKMGLDPEKIRCVSIMPCSAKKYEAAVPEASSVTTHDVDLSLTTRELGRMLGGMNVTDLPEEEFDSPLGTYTGAGSIFGATGGVMEAALRTAYYVVNGKNPEADAFSEIRAEEADPALVKCWRDAEFVLGDKTLRVAVASGLRNARALVDAILKGQVMYDFVEIMACPGGCAGGGGQPFADGEEKAFARGRELYRLDASLPVRFSHENEAVNTLYQEYLGSPLSERAEELLHTKQQDWK